MENFIKKNLTDLLIESGQVYASKVILDRAFPDVRDGLKPVQRRILWQTQQMNLHPKSKHTKVKTIVGGVMVYHPHGDMAIEGALTNMAQEWVKRVPLIDIQGSYGARDGSPAAAARYIEGRQAEATPLLFEGINKNAVDLVNNYDNTSKEPRVLPAAIPNALINGAEGIGYGMSSVILPHNPLELLEACQKIVKGEKFNIADVVLGPDFPTGGILIKNQGINDMLETGQGKITLRSKVDIVVDKKESYMLITELPYNIITPNFIESIIKALEKFPTAGVDDIIDESSGASKAQVKILFKKGTTKQHIEKVEQYLYLKSNLEITLHPKQNMISKGHYKMFGVREYLEEFLDFRVETLKRIWQFEIDKLISRLEILEGLLKLYDLTDEIIALAKLSEGKQDLTNKLIENFDYTERQADHIAGMPIYQLGRQDLVKLKEEHAENLKQTELLKGYISIDKETKKQLLADLKKSTNTLKNYTRKTQIISENNVEMNVEIKTEDLIESKKTKVIIKKDLQIFQIGQRAYDNQIKNYKDNDIVSVFDAMTTDYVIAITQSGRSVTRFVNDLEVLTLDGKAENLNKIIKDLTSTDEFIGGTIANTEKDVENLQVLVASEAGYTKLISAEKLLPNLNTKGYIKRLGKVSSLKKEGDKLAIVENFVKNTIDQFMLIVDLKDDSKKSGKVTRKIDLAKFKDRDDGQGGSGVNGFNTKSGELGFISYSIHEKNNSSENNLKNEDE